MSGYEANLRWREKNPEAYRASLARWRAANPEKRKAAQERHRTKLRREVIDAYGGKCECCGEDQIAFLTIEHKNRDGAEHRRELKSGSGRQFYAWLRANEFPQGLGLGVLCANCQMATWVGTCPHQDEK